MPSSPVTRNQLLDAASSLFYARGVTSTGVDAVVAASGVSKPTLYAHFGSKSELVAAVLRRRHDRRVASLRAWVASAASDPTERLLAVFDWLADFYATDAPRGCAFLNAAAETPDQQQPAREVVHRQKRWMRDYLAELAADAGLAEPGRLGAQLLLLIDGASARVLVNGAGEASEAAAEAKRAAAVLIEHAAAESPHGRPGALASGRNRR